MGALKAMKRVPLRKTTIMRMKERQPGAIPQTTTVDGARRHLSKILLPTTTILPPTTGLKMTTAAHRMASK
jgi:hypothetical protein